MHHEQIQPAAGKVVIIDQPEVDLLKEGGFDILGALLDNPTTTKQLALRLGLNRARVQFMIDKFIERGLIALYRATNEAGKIEQYYALTNKDLVVTLESDASDRAWVAIAQLISHSLQTNIARARSAPTPEAAVVLRLVQCKMQRGRVHEFMLKLRELADQFNAAEEETAEDIFALALGLYPVADAEGI